MKSKPTKDEADCGGNVQRANASEVQRQVRRVEYRVQSGAMDTTVTAGLDATAMEVAMLALERTTPKTLGVLIEVIGGLYVGQNVTYVLAETVCKKLGRWDENA